MKETKTTTITTCDRCKLTTTEENHPEFFNPRLRVTYQQPKNGERCFDLCSSCRKEVIEFILIFKDIGVPPIV